MSRPGSRRGDVRARTGPPGGPGAGEFPFRFTSAYRLSGLPFGVVPSATGVVVGGGVLEARFGLWRVTTPLANVAGTSVTGPYRWHLTAGSARYSFADHGLTFATNGELGLCIAFLESVTGLEPLGLLRHPSLTVTVADVVSLEHLLDGRPGALPTP